MMLKNIVYIVVGISFIFLYFRYFEMKALYFPMKDIEVLPDVVGLDYEEVYLDADDGIRLNGWYIPSGGSKYTLLFMHGNGGNISHRIEKILTLNKLGLDIFILDYRGYGKSKGRPSEKGLYMDGQAGYDFLVKEKAIPANRIILYGESLGGAVAVEIARKNNIKAVMLESTFTSTKDMAHFLYPMVPSFLISQRYDTAEKIKTLKVPKLIMHSRDDEIVPFILSEKLFSLASPPKEHIILTGTHNTCYADSKGIYLKAISDFINKL